MKRLIVKYNSIFREEEKMEIEAKIRRNGKKEKQYSFLKVATMKS